MILLIQYVGTDDCVLRSRPRPLRMNLELECFPRHRVCLQTPPLPPLSSPFIHQPIDTSLAVLWLTLLGKQSLHPPNGSYFPSDTLARLRCVVFSFQPSLLLTTSDKMPAASPQTVSAHDPLKECLCKSQPAPRGLSYWLLAVLSRQDDITDHFLFSREHLARPR